MSRSTKCKYYCRVFLTHLFSHVGLCGLVVGYAIVGALTFESLEAPYEISQRSTIQGYREKCLLDVWNITETMNVLYEKNWTLLVGMRLKQFENDIVHAVKNEGYDGKESSSTEVQWSFSGALLYCITVITTIALSVRKMIRDLYTKIVDLYLILGEILLKQAIHRCSKVEFLEHGKEKLIVKVENLSNLEQMIRNGGIQKNLKSKTQSADSNFRPRCEGSGKTKDPRVLIGTSRRV
ncbi:hypothetical protein AVEN_164793-1 [Araneus ventricosus]|uniref:Uncharacterized protein n=1 Tax=Araneus ventricosus TaxID=182803 RepID=A0A4Y2DR86_ARAVE|nr:hypothetical protein AVEN_164793-1 [Araneus ventricosus]